MTYGTRITIASVTNNSTGGSQYKLTNWVTASSSDPSISYTLSLAVVDSANITVWSAPNITGTIGGGDLTDNFTHLTTVLDRSLTYDAKAFLFNNNPFPHIIASATLRLNTGNAMFDGLVISSDKSTVNIGDNILFTVRPTLGGQPVAVGGVSLDLSIDGNVENVNMVTNASGIATISYNGGAFSVGTHRIVAYVDTQQPPTFSNILNFTVQSVPSYSISLAADDPTIQDASDPVIFSATVTQGGSPAGAVDVGLYVDGTLVITQTTDGTGHVSFSQTFSLGNHSVVAKAGSSTSNTIAISPKGGGIIGRISGNAVLAGLAASAILLVITHRKRSK